MTTTPEQPKCPECAGQTVTFRGRGMDLEYLVCTKYRESGHLTEAEICRVIADRRKREWPSGRYA